VRLQDFNDLDDIVGPGIAARPENAMHAFARLLELFGQMLKRDRCYADFSIVSRKDSFLRDSSSSCV
jgi:hypothetical protein